METSNDGNCPIVSDCRFTKEVSGDKVDVTRFKQMVRSLIYLAVTRPNIMFVVCLIS